MRDMVLNRTFYATIDFKDYMNDLKERKENENNVTNLEYYTFDRLLFEKNDIERYNSTKKDAYYQNCYNLTYIQLRTCILSKDNMQIEIFDAVNYTIQREDEGETSRYFFNYISFVIRNVPILPYVIESKNISVTVYNRSVFAEGQLPTGMDFDTYMA